MRGIFAILTSLGIGAALMYLFDPEGGNRRRALIRDKAAKLNRQARETLDSRIKDLSNRAKGTAHGVRSTVFAQTGLKTGGSASNWSDGPRM